MSLDYKVTPDLDLIEVRGWWNYADGSPATGVVHLDYDGPARFRDKATAHRTVGVRRRISVLIAATEVDWDGHGTWKTVGEARRLIPALTTDPDVEGGGGTYTCTVAIDGEPPHVFTVSADHAVPGGVLWISEMDHHGTPALGTPATAIRYADFIALEAHVADFVAASAAIPVVQAQLAVKTDKAYVDAGLAAVTFDAAAALAAYNLGKV